MKTLRRFVTWLYIKVVLIPAYKKAGFRFESLNLPEEDGDYQIEFTPEPELLAAIESEKETKH